MSIHVWGIDLVEVGFKGIHAFMAAAWLLFDFIVFWLHFDIKNPAISTERRLERARIMHGIDTIVRSARLLECRKQDWLALLPSPMLRRRAFSYQEVTE